MKNYLTELNNIINKYEQYTDKACEQGVYTEKELQEMDEVRYRFNQIIQSFEKK